MLSADVRFEGFTQTDWARVLSLFAPRRAEGGERDPDRPRGGVIAVHGGGRLRKLVHTEVGRLRLDDVASAWPLEAAELARRHHASWAVVVEIGALEDVMESFGARARRGDTFTAQLLLLVTLLREQLLEGRIEHWPVRLAGMPVPTEAMIDHTLDALCQREHVIALGLFDGGELYTSIAMRRGRAGGIDWILGPDELRRDMGLLAGDWRRDHRHLARAVERRMGKLALGVYAEASTLRRLEVDPTPGAWAKAVAVRDVILQPVPVALALPLGIDAGRAAVSALRGVLDRAGASEAAAPLVGTVRSTLGDLADALGLTPAPGSVGGLEFDLLELLRRLLVRER